MLILMQWRVRVYIYSICEGSNNPRGGNRLKKFIELEPGAHLFIHFFLYSIKIEFATCRNGDHGLLETSVKVLVAIENNKFVSSSPIRARYPRAHVDLDLRQKYTRVIPEKIPARPSRRPTWDSPRKLKERSEKTSKLGLVYYSRETCKMVT